MKIASEWKDYKVIATGDGEKLENWNGVVLLRPDPQVIWHAKKELNIHAKKINNSWYWELDKIKPDLGKNATMQTI